MERAPPAYRLLDHTADIAFEVEAPTLASLFARAALAIHDIAADTGAARPLVARPIEVEGHDLGDALVRFLEESLFAFEAEGLIFAAIEGAAVAGDGPVRARATGRGEPFDPARHELRRPLKAVTYHDLAVAPLPEGGFGARVVCDL